MHDMNKSNTNEAESLIADDCQPDPNQLHFLLCKVRDLERECQRLHSLNDKLLDEMCKLRLHAKTRLGPGSLYWMTIDPSISFLRSAAPSRNI